jgi:hypothetical protein
MKESPALASDSGRGRFYALLFCAAAFAYYSGGRLPPVVGTHFNAAGVATGFMPRSVYRYLAVAMVVIPPWLLAVMPALSLRNPRARINVPNSVYWLSPQRRPETVAVIVQEVRHFGELLLLFMCYAQWLVVRANRQQPPNLSSHWLLAGLVVFLALTARWASRFVGRFRLEG